MKKVLILLVLLPLLLLWGCAGAGDWVSEPLTENYVILRSSANHIMLCRERDSGSYDIIINALVYRVAYNSDFICIQQAQEPGVGEQLPIQPEVRYYIVQVSDGRVYGPYTHPEYEARLQALQITDLSHWAFAKEFMP